MSEAVIKVTEEKKPLGYSIIKGKDMDSSGAMNLIAAVFNQAKHDYIHGVSGRKLRDVQKEIDRYLHNERSLINYMNPATPDDTLANWEIQRKYYIWRKAHKCNQCKKKKYANCPHKSGDHYTAEWTCIKEEADANE